MHAAYKVDTLPLSQVVQFHQAVHSLLVLQAYPALQEVLAFLVVPDEYKNKVILNKL